MTFVDRETRSAQLRMARSELLLYPLWHGPYLRRPLLERVKASPFIFCMGIVNLFSAATGAYFGGAVSWLGYQQVRFSGLCEGGR